MTKVEELLNALLNGETLDIEPRTRVEAYLKNCCEGCGCDGLPTPITTTDALLYALSEKLASGGGTGGGGASVAEKDVNFYDYDGTVLYAYTVEEAQALTELPALPEREGLICQGWNWSLEDIKAHNCAVNVGATYITDDGKTRIYITLTEGRTSPMLGVCPKGTVTVDWGDGTEPDVLTGTSTTSVKWTPNHNYASAGDYVISLTVDGEMSFYGSLSSTAGPGILRCSSSGDNRNAFYLGSVRKLEIGEGVTSIVNAAFYNCYSLVSVNIPNGVTSIGNDAFSYCYSLVSVNIPNGVTSIGNNAFSYCYILASVNIPNGVTSIGFQVFNGCYNLASVNIPNGVTSIGGGVFNDCYNLASVNTLNGVTSIGSSMFSNCYKLASVNIPNGVTSIGNNAFSKCRKLASVNIPNSVTSIGQSAFSDCYKLASVNIPNGVTSIGNNAFYCCYSLASVNIPNGVTSIGYSIFYSCFGLRYLDFSEHTAVPTLVNTGAFSNTPADLEIRVPAALYDEWIAATNWSSLASQIVAV